MSTVTAPVIDPDALTAEVGGDSTAAKWAKLSVQPVIVLLVLGGFAVWKSTATFDSIEGRQLAWSNILERTWEHIQLSVAATVVVLVVAIPLGVLLTRGGMRKAAPFFVGVANIGQAAPAVGLVILFVLLISLGFWTTVLALFLFGLLPALRNTIVGLEQVDQRLVEAARGMGMTGWATLFRVELPLAVPIILAGARTALVLLVGTAAFGALVDAGGLGGLIVTGIKLTRPSVLVSGGLLVASLALIIDWLGRVVEEVARPKGV